LQRTMAQAIPEGQYLEIPGADHFSLSTDAAAQQVVADFLAGPTGDPGRD
jgi:hypothetical protein